MTTTFLRRVITLPILGYQRLVSPLLGPRCRYYPSCSSYALEAITLHGALAGLRMSVWRLLRCNPFSPGGVDHVPGHEPPAADPTLTPGALAC
jgi:putative membrane protein insertion efficiency factor